MPISSQRQSDQHSERSLPHAAKEMYSVFAMKNSRKRAGLPLSKVTLYHSTGEAILTFLVEHNLKKTYPAGSFARVKKAFSLEEGKAPRYALKAYKSFPDRDPSITMRRAMRSSYCSRLLERTGFAFQLGGKQYFLTDWLSGRTLEDIPVEEVIAIPIPRRIEFVLSLLRQIALLHYYGLFNLDINPSNVILNDESLSIIDFDSVRVAGDRSREIIFSPQFMSAHLNYILCLTPCAIFENLNPESDIYALGATLLFLFPDIISTTYGTKTLSIHDKTFHYDTIRTEPTANFTTHAALGNFLLKLIADDRPRTMEEIYCSLRSVSASVTIPRPLSLVERPPVFMPAKSSFNQIEAELVANKARSKIAKIVRIKKEEENYSFALNCYAVTLASAALLLVIGSAARNDFCQRLGTEVLVKGFSSLTKFFRKETGRALDRAHDFSIHATLTAARN
jgi:serine/threonine protein kinase